MRSKKRTSKIIAGVIGALCIAVIMMHGVPDVNAERHQHMDVTADTAGDPVSPGTITEDMRCPVCGMYPARYPEWHSHIIFRDGSIAAFDGCKDLFTFLLDIKRFDGSRSSEDVAAVFVKDFISGEWINAKDAYFVAGSSKTGPMGKELIPFAGHMDAMRFHEKHGGFMTRYSEITQETVKSLSMGGMKMQKDGGHMEKHGDH